jgi:tRNA modification GTPase
MIRDGATVVITGRTNVGKSSLFNALVGHDRAIVTAAPGTTRDLVTETIQIDGLSIRLVDTAGLRDATDDAEREGVSRSVRAREVADVVLLVLDHSEPLGVEDRELLNTTESSSRVVVANKVDRASSDTVTAAIPVSAITGVGIGDLRRALIRALIGDEGNRDTAAISNVRHVSLMEQARARLAQARDASMPGGVPEEFILADLHAARGTFDEVLGIRTSEDVLRHIFERFCIGK